MSNDHVYVVGSKEFGSRVKIGWSAQPEERVKQLQIGSPCKLELLDKHPGPSGLEDFLHGEFDSRRTHGEWFDFGDRDPLPLIAKAVDAWRDKVNKGEIPKPRQGVRRAAVEVDPHKLATLRRRAKHLSSLECSILTICARKGGFEGGVSLTVHDVLKGQAHEVPGFSRSLQRLLRDRWIEHTHTNGVVECFRLVEECGD